MAFTMMMPTMANNKPFRSSGGGGDHRRGGMGEASSAAGAGSAVVGAATAPAIASSEGDVYLRPDPVDPCLVASPHGVPRERRFSPYDFNGGTVAAVAGPDYAIIASDTRLSSGYEILSRNVPKLHKLTSHCVLGSAGCKTDVDQLRAVLDIKMKVS